MTRSDERSRYSPVVVAGPPHHSHCGYFDHFHDFLENAYAHYFFSFSLSSILPHCHQTSHGDPHHHRRYHYHCHFLHHTFVLRPHQTHRYCTHQTFHFHCPLLHSMTTSALPSREQWIGRRKRKKWRAYTPVGCLPASYPTHHCHPHRSTRSRRLGESPRTPARQKEAAWSAWTTHV